VAQDVDPAAEVFFHPHPRAACSAAHRLFTPKLELEWRVASQHRDDRARRLVFTIVPREVARLVIDDALERPVDADTAVGKQSSNQLRVVHDFVVPAKIGILVP